VDATSGEAVVCDGGDATDETEPPALAAATSRAGGSDAPARTAACVGPTVVGPAVVGPAVVGPAVVCLRSAVAEATADTTGAGDAAPESPGGRSGRPGDGSIDEMLNDCGESTDADTGAALVGVLVSVTACGQIEAQYRTQSAFPLHRAYLAPFAPRLSATLKSPPPFAEQYLTHATLPLHAA